VTDPAPIRLADAEATADLARALAPRLGAGDAIALTGPMGAGKTTFTRALVAALGGDAALVASPTYTLLNQYEATVPVVHVDASRLSGPGELEAIGFCEVSAGAVAVAVVEWPEKVAACLPEGRTWRIDLDHRADGRRTALVADPTGAPWWPAAPVTVIPGRDGRDPLVDAYLAAHEPTSALRTVAWGWLALCVPLLTVAAVGGSWLAGGADATGLTGPRAEAMRWLGSIPGALAGIAGGALVLSLAGEFLFRRGGGRGFEPWLAALPVAALFLAGRDWLVALGVGVGLLSLVFAFAIAYRLLALVMGGGAERRDGRAADPEAAPAGGWPSYTVLVPLYREPEIVGQLVGALTTLDYPRDRLQVLVLMEQDDAVTLAAFQARPLPPWMRLVVVPEGRPKTKPRACNHGLALATGDLLVIYDAEDRPEPDQLKQAALAFADAPARMACLQAQLAFRNHDTNLLTRWFTIEYNVWFRRYLRGLERLGCPVPLGGTSNHFRTAVLREVGGWDPFNVTEDCDLGVRLHLRGHRTGLLASVTWEEAVGHVGAWIKQRTRWLKGYYATHLVWWRTPVATAWRLGPAGLPGFAAAVTLVPVLAALALPLWGLELAYLATLARDWAVLGADPWLLLTRRGDEELWAQRWSWPLAWTGPDEDPVLSGWSVAFAITSAALTAANLIFIAVALLAGRRPGQHGLIGAALLVPFYWVLQGLAAWRALWHLMVKPHRWEKTTHGVDPAAR
jgi:tRNA threonylcarbamoyl adenosine modification protein YjeE